MAGCRLFGSPGVNIEITGVFSHVFDWHLAALEAVSVVMRPAFAFGAAVPLPRQFIPGAPAVRAPYDILPDDRFVGVVPVGDSDAIDAAPQIQVVLNWQEELKRLVSANR